MRVSTALRAAVIPALLVTLAACSDDAPPPPDPTSSAAEVTTEGTSTTEQGTDRATDSETSQSTDTANAQGNGELYTALSGVTECPSVDEISSITGLDFSGTEPMVEDSFGTLNCGYGSDNLTDSGEPDGPAVFLTIEADDTATLLAEPTQSEFDATGSDLQIAQASEFGDNAWYIQASANTEMGIPTMCTLGVGVTNDSGDVANLMVMVANPDNPDTSLMCNAAGAIARSIG